MFRQKYCSECRSGFMAQRDNAKFCSDKCKQLAYRKRNGQTSTNRVKDAGMGNAVRRTCPHCSSRFYLNRYGRTRKFCSDSCKVSANRIKIAATKQLLTRLLHADYHMKPFHEAAKKGTDAFEKLVASVGYEYSFVHRTYMNKYEIGQGMFR